MNEASDLAVSVFGEAGKHTCATVGAAPLPLNSVVEIQAIFEVDGKVKAFRPAKQVFSALIS